VKLSRDEMIRRICELAKPMLVRGYYVRSYGDIDGYLDVDFCLAHARIVAAWGERETGDEHRCYELDSPTDGHRQCCFGGDIYGCQLHLDLGGLTDEGVRSALGLTEEKPEECSVYASELELAARELSADDERWKLWELHARRVLRSKR
jgi:hypothetical protein